MVLRRYADEVVCHGALFVIAVASGVDIRKLHYDRTRRLMLVDDGDVFWGDDRTRSEVEGCRVLRAARHSVDPSVRVIDRIDDVKAVICQERERTCEVKVRIRRGSGCRA